MHLQPKKDKKGAMVDPKGKAALKPSNIAVKRLNYEEVKQEFTDSLLEHFESTRKIFPSFSVNNPLVLNQIRVHKRQKYI